MQLQKRFRFWKTDEKRWFYFDFSTYMTYKKDIDKALDDGLTLYQYTGIEDILGKCVYEGDYVCVSGTEEVYEVAYDMDCLGFVFKSPSVTCTFDQFTGQLEVIGSIKDTKKVKYEN